MDAEEADLAGIVGAAVVANVGARELVISEGQARVVALGGVVSDAVVALGAIVAPLARRRAPTGGAFVDAEERRMFTMLLSVSGIGPNSAQTILSGMTVADLQQAITQNRVTDLTQIRGVGRKTAERVVVELRDKVSATIAQPQIPAGNSASGVAAEAVLALVALGIAESAASKAVDKAVSTSDSEPSVQELIKRALRDR